VLTRLYNWTMDLAAQPYALWALALVAFAESSVFPIPPDVMLIPMVLAARAQAWVIAGVCTIASVLGGIAGYGIGYFLYEAAGQPIIAFYAYEHQFVEFQGLYAKWGAWIVVGAGFTPIPYKIFTIASGVAQLDVTTFTVASLLSRGARYFLVAVLLWYFGPLIRAFIEGNLRLLVTLFFALLLGGFLALSYLV
jgi:membrane protein YqaA with SNARE-associated domain